MGSKDSTELLEILQIECETAINWFKTNNMVVNPSKFQSMTIGSKKDLSKSVLNINGLEAEISKRGVCKRDSILPLNRPCIQTCIIIL